MRLLHQPFEWWQANAFWPNPDSLAFADAFIGYTPVALLGTGFRAAIWHYNVVFLFAYALSFAGAYLLARELGLGRPAAAVAGVAFAYSPWRWEQSAHLHVLSSGGIPLCLMLLLRGYRRKRPAAVVAGWLVAAWQVLIGVSLALQLLYLLAILTAVGAVFWWRAGRPAPTRRIVLATTVGLTALAIVCVVVAGPYLRVADEYPESHRTLRQRRVLLTATEGVPLRSAGEPRLGQDHGRRARGPAGGFRSRRSSPGPWCLPSPCSGCSATSGRAACGSDWRRRS